MKCGTVLVLILQVATAAAIRTKNASADVNSSAAEQSEADQALSAVAGILDAHKADAVKKNSSANATHRAKLDVGFTDFDKDLIAKVTSAIENSTQNAEWTKELRQELVQNVTGAFSAGVKDALKPVKQSIGKTWMALPEDDQKNEYVSQLKNGFSNVLASNLQTLMSHLQIGLRRLEAYGQSLKARELLEKSEKTLESDILSDRCYGGDSLLQFSSMDQEELEAYKNASATLAKKGGANKTRAKFCLPSVVNNLVKRLNDTQMLLSMTMRFEARAMDMVQTGAKKIKK